MAEASPRHSSVDPHTVYSSEKEDGSIWTQRKTMKSMKPSWRTDLMRGNFLESPDCVQNQHKVITAIDWQKTSRRQLVKSCWSGQIAYPLIYKVSGQLFVDGCLFWQPWQKHDNLSPTRTNDLLKSITQNNFSIPFLQMSFETLLTSTYSVLPPNRMFWLLVCQPANPDATLLEFTVIHHDGCEATHMPYKRRSRVLPLPFQGHSSWAVHASHKPPHQLAAAPTNHLRTGLSIKIHNPITDFRKQTIKGKNQKQIITQNA